jgi:hypothetical protein
MKKLRHVRLLIMLMLLLIPLSSAQGALADRLATLQDLHTLKSGHLVATFEFLSNGNRIAATNEISTALNFDDILASVNQGVTEGDLTLKVAKQLVSAFSKEAKTLGKLYDTLNDVRKGQTAVYAALKNTAKAFDKTDATIAKIGGGGIQTMAEVNAKTAGFHNPYDYVTFKVSGLPPGECLSNGSVKLSIVSTATSLGYHPVYEPEIIGCDTFQVQMGPDQGGAMVVATFPDGHTRKWGLYNYGKNGAKITNAAFVGCYAASASGSITVPLPDGSSYTASAAFTYNYCVDTSGKGQVTQTDFDFNFANGGVKIGNGYLSINVKEAGGSFSMNGALTVDRNGMVTGGGTWSFTSDLGSGGGVWSVKRTS